MPDADFLQKLSARAAALLPAAEARRKELEGQMYKLLQGSLGKLNVVTREEFDAQQQVLERARARLQELEQKVAELERRGDTAP